MVWSALLSLGLLVPKTWPPLCCGETHHPKRARLHVLHAGWEGEEGNSAIRMLWRQTIDVPKAPSALGDVHYEKLIDFSQPSSLRALYLFPVIVALAQGEFVFAAAATLLLVLSANAEAPQWSALVGASLFTGSLGAYDDASIGMGVLACSGVAAVGALADWEPLVPAEYEAGAIEEEEALWQEDDGGLSSGFSGGFIGGVSSSWETERLASDKRRYAAAEVDALESFDARLAARAARAAEQEKAACQAAARALEEDHPALFKESPRCRRPHLHADSLVDALVAARVMSRHGLTDSGELSTWLLTQNDRLRQRPDAEWLSGVGSDGKGVPREEGAFAKALQKARNCGLFLGMEESWLDDTI